ncbi:hypothetical protein JMN32_22430 [Fulvivirga sp. 29W222]|uniref:Uncharacterized protein n=1 Tax=Fulvivirga marina TaxID=2494733 RepID=A0A937G322_9BACT|nr:hypothetical protein [Fulvivirga marina]MBL6449085.1 hypothetical protein [Fulvivirga marina]
MIFDYSKRDHLEKMIRYGQVAEWSFIRSYSLFNMGSLTEDLINFSKAFDFISYDTIVIGNTKEDLGGSNVWKSGDESWVKWLKSLNESTAFYDIPATVNFGFYIDLVDAHDRIVETRHVANAGNLNFWNDTYEEVPYVALTFDIKLNLFGPKYYLNDYTEFELPERIHSYNRKLFNKKLHQYTCGVQWRDIEIESRKPFYLNISESGFKL